MKKITLFLILFVGFATVKAQKNPYHDSFKNVISANHDSIYYIVMSQMITSALPSLVSKRKTQLEPSLTFKKDGYVISVDFSYKNDSTWFLILCEEATLPEGKYLPEDAWESFYVHEVTRKLVISSYVPYDFIYQKRLGGCGYTRGGDIGDKKEALDFLIAALSVL